MGEELEIKIWDYRKLKIRKTLGGGSFGTVYLANCVEPDVTNPVVMKVIHNSVAMRDDSRRLFMKEAILLSSLHHENIVRIYGICLNPLTIIMEYVVFDFDPFQRNRKVSSLDEFLSEIAGVPQSEEHRFEQLIPKIAVDVARGVAHLHGQNIAHRDLKPMNILISNQHYCKLHDRRQIMRLKAERPIICKLADFGESRSQWLQTNGLRDPDTSQIFRGTIAFMAPEILLREPTVQGNKLTMDDLKKVDIWALGMVFYCLINPADPRPYERDGCNHPVDIMKFQKQRKLPSFDPKYMGKQSSAWKHVKDVFNACTNYDPLGRPKATQVHVMLDASAGSGNHSSLKTDVVPLNQKLSSTSQGTLQWYASTQGESDVKYIQEKLKAIADGEVDMSRNKDSRDLCLRFQCSRKRWKVRFPANFPASNASLYVDGVFYAMVGGNTIKTCVRELISTLIQPKSALVHGDAAKVTADQWYENIQGEAALRYVLNELANFADSEVKMSRRKDTHDVTLSFTRDGDHWEIRFPPDFPRSEVNLSNGEFSKMVGGDNINTAVQAMISAMIQVQPKRAGENLVPVTRMSVEQWYAGDQGEAALRYVSRELRDIADGELGMSRKKDTHDITLRLKRNGQHWEITFPSNFPKSNTSLFKSGEFYAMVGGDQLETAVREIINRIKTLDQSSADVYGHPASGTTEQWYAGHSGEAALRYVFDALREIADGEVKMRRNTDTQDITLSLRHREREWQITFPFNFPKSNAGVSTNGKDKKLISGNTVENSVSVLINHITSAYPSHSNIASTYPSHSNIATVFPSHSTLLEKQERAFCCIQ